MKIMKFQESYGKISDDRQFDHSYWQQLGPEAIFEAAYEMIKDYLMIKEKNVNEPRLQRSVESYQKVKGVEFDIAWQNKEVVKISDKFEINFIGREDLIKTKEAAGRPQDLIDLDNLKRISN